MLTKRMAMPLISMVSIDINTEHLRVLIGQNMTELHPPLHYFEAVFPECGTNFVIPGRK